MTFQEAIKAKIGPERYSHIDKEARNEVTRAMQMPLKDEHGQDRFYRPRFLLREFLADCESFEKAKLNVLPMDILDVLFRCKLLFAAKTEHEYRQRGGGGFFWDNFGASPTWLNRAEALDALESRYIGNVEGDVRERTLLTYISSFVSKDLDVSPQQAFFEDLFASFEAPFVIYLDGTHLIEKHKSLQPGLRNYEL